MKWNIKKIISKGQYNYALVLDHPNSTKNGYVLEHRVIMENNIGRLLQKGEIIHHINGIKKDNRIENLSITNLIDHGIHHHKKDHFVTLKCDNCSSNFKRKFHQRPEVKGNKFLFCSRRCQGIHFHKRKNKDLIA